MRRRFLILRLAVLAGIVVFVVKAPPFIETQLNRNYYEEWVTLKPSEWKGVIRVWNVYNEARFDAEVLSSAIRRFEKLNRGAYIACITLPCASVEERASIYGEPDVWIFPEGMMEALDGDCVMLLPQPSSGNAVIDEFEFDVGECGEGASERENHQRFVVSVRAEDERGRYAGVFVELLHEKADDACR